VTALNIVIAFISAYVLGSLPTAYVVGRLRRHEDIREVGTRNMGAMNTFYEVGFVWGLIVLLVDIAKGAASMAIAETLGLDKLAYPGYVAYMATGLMALLGHAFPVFLNFRGGKGGASAIGVLVWMMKPWSMPIYAGAFLVFFAVTRAPTVAYSLAFVVFPFMAWYAFGRWEWIIFTVVLLMVPGIRYIPRIKEMRQRAGSWSRVLRRKDVGDRF
jgi:glycerol-3-phosphate acyltransferase PlsY